MSSNIKKISVVARRDFRQQELRAEQLPNRYSIRNKDDYRVLLCSESPSLAVRIERGLSIPFEEVIGIEELARADIGENRIAIVCRSEKGVYEVEPELRRLHGNHLGVIVLQKDPTTYTLRQVDRFPPYALENVYEQLNLMDKEEVADSGEWW